MHSATYTEFRWGSTGPANGQSGIGLANTFIGLVAGLDGVKRICDLGCGNGYITGHLAALGYDITGVDASESGIRIASESHPLAHFVCSLLDGALGARVGLEPFDLVLSSDVIEHLYRPADLLEAARSVLRPNGQILVGTPYHGYLKNLALSVTGRMDSHFCVLDDCGHIKFFSVKSLSELVSRYGFSNLNFSFYGRAPWLWKNMICHARLGE